MLQQTIKNVIKASGLGLHGGEKVMLTLRPGVEDSGIIFRRVDLDPVCEIHARVNAVFDTNWCTTIGCDEHIKVATVEHLVSAAAGLGIDNLVVEIDAAEVPIMDGSSAPFVFLLQSAGIKKQNNLKKFLKIKKHVMVQSGDSWAKLDPYNGFSVAMEIDYEHPVLKSSIQVATWDFSETSYIREIARARTFGFIAEYEWLKSRGLALGGSLHNAVVVGDDQVLNEDGLRCKNEFVKHKILDAIGDLYLAGANIVGSFVGYKSGHTLNNLLLKKVFSCPENYEYVTYENQSDCPILFN